MNPDRVLAALDERSAPEERSSAAAEAKDGAGGAGQDLGQRAVLPRQ